MEILVFHVLLDIMEIVAQNSVYLVKLRVLNAQLKLLHVLLVQLIIFYILQIVTHFVQLLLMQIQLNSNV